MQVSYMPKECNHRADHMVKVGSGSRPHVDKEGASVTIKKRSLPSIQRRGLFTEICTILMEDEICTILMEDSDWRAPIIGFLSSTLRQTDKRTRMFATRFVLLDDELFKRGIDNNTLL